MADLGDVMLGHEVIALTPSIHQSFPKVETSRVW